MPNKRVSLVDVLTRKGPDFKTATAKKQVREAVNTAAKKKTDQQNSVKLGETMAATTTKRRSEDPYINEPTKMLKEGTRNRSPEITSSKEKNQTKAGVYPTYNKGSSESDSFKSAFAAARKAGKKNFTWQDRSYNTKVK